MLDKLDLEVPFAMPFTTEFRRHWNNPQNDDLFRKKKGTHYEVTGDLRGVGIPAILSCGHRHHKRLGPKLELVKVGEAHYSDWLGTIDQVFKGDVEDCSIMRLDATADIEGYSVDQLARAHICKHKRTNQDLGSVEYDEFRRVAKMASQTMYHGIKPRQLRIYNKTLHRLKELLPALNRERARQHLRPLTFDQVYGYSAEKLITRIERQMGAREPEQRWGVRELGNLPYLMKCDPFEQLTFRDDLTDETTIDDLETSKRIYVLLLRERIARDGLDQSRAWLRGQYGNEGAEGFRTFWRRYGHLLVERIPVTREMLTTEFHRTLALQLAA